jgi:hypothetical protein
LNDVCCVVMCCHPLLYLAVCVQPAVVVTAVFCLM